MGIFDFVKKNMNNTKMQAENAYQDAVRGKDIVEVLREADEWAKNQQCFADALDLYQEACKRSETAKMAGYMRAIQVLYESNGVKGHEPFLENQWYRLKERKYYQALFVYERLLAKDGYLEKDSAGRYIWRK